IPKIITEEMPLSAIDCTRCEILRTGVTAMPGMDFIMLGLLETNTGNTRWLLRRPEEANIVLKFSSSLRAFRRCKGIPHCLASGL
ncbi:MAG TPA: hypothetical protein VE264_04580, partial [Nitrososphaera sp.]|nr:hypothetical protein [Nitrososphaera sp.]